MSGGKLKDAGHFIRAAILFGVGLVVFLAVREALVPKDFGKFGHYRAGALADISARPVSYGGRAACVDCHSDIEESRQGSRHDRVNCETCHGALAAHASNPDSVRPVLPDPVTLCRGCHERNAARPATFPQVDIDEHSAGEPCTSCHKPHHPEME